MDLTERIEYIMKVNQLSASSFAEKIGVQRSSISHILSGRNKPSLDFITRVLNTFPRVNASWLITGETGTEVDTVQQPSGRTKAGEEKSSPAKSSVPASGKQIERILVFYDDQSFEEYLPGNKE